MAKRPRVAFITTKEYRSQSESRLREFIYEDLGFLVRHFDVLSTGRTHKKVLEIVDDNVPAEYMGVLADFLQVEEVTPADLERWRKLFRSSQFNRLADSVEGMIEIAYELVEGRLDAVLHLTDWNQVSGKPPAMVVRRQANVHNVYMATDLTSIQQAVRKWHAALAGGNTDLFRKKEVIDPSPIAQLSGDVLALIAHDAKKLDMCWFVVDHARQIMKYDYILATGTTGSEVARFLIAAGQSEKEVRSKIRLCLSGPKGGDVQIAAAVIRNLCLQDPMSSHAHETDIHLFEQAPLLFREAALKVNFELAFNVESARMLL